MNALSRPLQSASSSTDLVAAYSAACRKAVETSHGSWGNNGLRQLLQPAGYVL
jgi:hypothetical protein